jgi:NAD(P)-dependent dehydrogenase (short-subunit alcohol dehydrogenase family)
MNALVIGNSDGIGLALTRRLLAAGWTVIGVSRSPSPIAHERYEHRVCDVRAAEYAPVLAEACARLTPVDACIYCAGVAAALDLTDLDSAAFAAERAVFEVNLMGAVTTVHTVLPVMVDAGRGHLVAVSSQADAVRDPGAPGYAASKAGLSSYMESLALAALRRGVHVTNVRFGFVTTKLSRADGAPFAVTPERAAAVMMRCLARRPMRVTYPKRMAALLWLVTWPQRLRRWFT